MIQGVLSIGLFIAIIALLQSVGLIKTGEERRTGRKSKKFSSLMTIIQKNAFVEWIGKYENENGRSATVAKVSGNIPVTVLSERLYNAKGSFNDDEDKLYSVFRECQYLIDLALLNANFKRKYGIDIASYVEGFTDETEQGKIFNIISKYQTHKGSRIDGNRIMKVLKKKT